MSGRPGAGSVVVAAPDDRLSRLLVAALAALPGVADCRFVAAPDRAGYLQLAEALELAEGIAGGAVLVYRLPRGGASGAGLPDRADAQALLAACDRRRPAAVVLVASAAAVEPRHDHPGHTAELPRLPVRHPVARAWTELEDLFASRLGMPPPVALTILRPAAVALPGSGDLASHLLGRRVAFVPAGFDPALQLLDPADFVAAVARATAAALEARGAAPEPVAEVPTATSAGAAGTPTAVAPTAPPDARTPAQAAAATPRTSAMPGTAAAIYQVAPAGVVPLRAALRLAGTRRVPVPTPLLSLARRAAARFGGPAPSAGELDYLCHPSTVSGEALRRELGWTARTSSAAAVARGFGAARRRPARRGEEGAAFGDGAAAGEAVAGGGKNTAAGESSTASEPAAAGEAAVPELDDFDDFGMDRGYIAACGRTLFRFLHRWYWRVETRGLEHVPKSGRAVLVGVHRGFMPWDGVMLLHTLVTRLRRYPRFLIHPTLVKFPFLAPYMTKLGGMIACQENADWVLSRGELLGMFPEGIRGAFTMYRDAYRLGRFGRDEYVRMALRHGAPLVPFVTVGSAEIYPILGKIHWRWFTRFSEWPYLPLTPTFPLLPVPLPSKWHTQFLAPFEVAPRYPPEAADDPETVRAISREIRGRMQEALDDLRRRRRSIFFGSIFGPEPDLEPEAETGPRPGVEPPAVAGPRPERRR
jgi:1-acyl-sn-glycerol-3-phosphate acyltransferase